jgi:hypothetical protein
MQLVLRMKAILLLAGLTAGSAVASTRCVVPTNAELWLIVSLGCMSLLLATILMQLMRRGPLRWRVDALRLGLAVAVGLALLPFVGAVLVLCLLSALPLLVMFVPSFVTMGRGADETIVSDPAAPSDPRADHRVRSLVRR